MLYKINELSYLKKTHCYIRQNLVETNNKIILLEKKLKELDEENNYKFPIISYASNLLDINSKIIKTNGYDRIFLGSNIMPHNRNLNCSEQLYKRFLKQFRNIKIIEIEFLKNEKREMRKFDIMRMLIEAFRDFEIIFKCVSLYSEYENFFNIIMNSSNYRKITLYIKNNVNKQTGDALYVTHPYINELKSHCIENNIEIQSNIGI